MPSGARKDPRCWRISSYLASCGGGLIGRDNLCCVLVTVVGALGSPGMVDILEIRSPRSQDTPLPLLDPSLGALWYPVLCILSLSMASSLSFSQEASVSSSFSGVRAYWHDSSLVFSSKSLGPCHFPLLTVCLSMTELESGSSDLSPDPNMFSFFDLTLRTSPFCCYLMLQRGALQYYGNGYLSGHSANSDLCSLSHLSCLKGCSAKLF